MAPVEAVKKVMVVGGSGNMGTLILDGILKSGLFTVSVLSRSKSEAVFPTGVQVVKTDYTQASLEKALSGQDAVVSVVGAAGFKLQIPLIDAAAKVGVKHFLPAEFSANSQSEVVRKTIPLFEIKKEVLDHLRSKESSGLAWTGLAVGPLLDWCLEAGFLGFDLNNRTATIWDDGNTLFSLTNLQTMCQAVVSILSKPEQTANKYLYVASVTTSQNRILQELEKCTGSKWTTKSVTTAGQVEAGNKLLSEGNFTGALMLVQASGWGNIPGLCNNYEKDEQLANSLLELPDETVEDTVQRFVKENKYNGSLHV